jgi:hypothetical protein
LAGFGKQLSPRVATLRVQGMSPVALKAEIENRYKNKTYNVPQKAGLSYMVAPIMRTRMLPDMQVHTMPMPHEKTLLNHLCAYRDVLCLPNEKRDARVHATIPEAARYFAVRIRVHLASLRRLSTTSRFGLPRSRVHSLNLGGTTVDEEFDAVDEA